MGNNKLFATNLIVVILICYVNSTISHDDNKESEALLSVGFYEKSCPNVESIIQEVVWKAVLNDSGIAASLIRLHFHDCFVKGCDASILLDKTPSGKRIEKTSPGNIGVRGFEVIDEAKTQLEKACPDTVSCADIIAYAARDAVTISGISHYDVPAGRRDGLESLESNVFGNLPLPSSNVGQMNDIFTKKRMDKSDIVTLLGAHSIGVAHCFLFDNEIHNFNATHQSNPKLNKLYAMVLRSICPAPSSPKSNTDNVLPLNMFMGNKLSTLFYNNVVGGRVVIPADQSLLDDEFTSEMVTNYVVKSWKWANDFRDAMIKLGKVDLLTGEQGQIRKNCREINN
ncbi:hypothetical protein RND81_09G023900 [Saponaria officinalis]|uniref:Peroxidase n=1 Tax=Saponaria officinalis TaxID=3572 RepID=A0AAW1IGQ4_SAPOF